jgi:hypothetical protein
MYNQKISSIKDKQINNYEKIIIIVELDTFEK